MVKPVSDAPVRIAVVGSGLAGLVTAYILSKADFRKPDGTRLCFEIHLFEKQSALGMDSSSISVKTGKGDATFRIDTPMRSINGGSHDRVWKLYKHLHIPLRLADFSYAFSQLSSSPSPLPSSASPPPCATPPTQKTAFIYAGSDGLRFPPLSFPSHINSMFSRVPYLWHMLLLAFSYLHLLLLAFFYRFTYLQQTSWMGEVLACAGLNTDPSETLGAWCARNHIWSEMREAVLEPLVAAVTTVERDAVVNLPVGDVLEYITSTFGSPHFVAALGVKEVVSKLSAPLSPSQIHLSTTISSIALSSTPGSRIEIQSSSTPSTSPLLFSDVILAVQANQACALLQLFATRLSAREQKREMRRIDALAEFGYVTSVVVNHTDISILPPNVSDHRDLNLVSYLIPPPDLKHNTQDTTLLDTSILSPSHIQSTHILSRTHPSLPSSLHLLQTTNPILPIDPKLIKSQSWFQRAVVSKGSKKVLPLFILPNTPGKGNKTTTRGEFQGHNGIWLVGSWCAEGLPLLEGCVLSAERVARAIAEREGANMVNLF